MVCPRISITKTVGINKSSLTKAKDIATDIVAMTTALLKEME